MRKHAQGLLAACLRGTHVLHASLRLSSKGSKGERGTRHNKRCPSSKNTKGGAEFLLISVGKARGSSEGSQSQGGLRKHN